MKYWKFIGLLSLIGVLFFTSHAKADTPGCRDDGGGWYSSCIDDVTSQKIQDYKNNQACAVGEKVLFFGSGGTPSCKTTDNKMCVWWKCSVDTMSTPPAGTSCSCLSVSACSSVNGQKVTGSCNSPLVNCCYVAATNQNAPAPEQQGTCPLGTCVIPAMCDVAGPADFGYCSGGLTCCAQTKIGTAQTVTPDGQAPGTTPTAEATKTTEAGYSGADKCSLGGYNFPNPFGCGATIPGIVARVIYVIMGIVGALFFGLFIWGGVRYILAGGDSAKVGEAQQTIINAVMGMAVIVFSYSIVNWLIGWFSSAA